MHAIHMIATSVFFSVQMASMICGSVRQAKVDQVLLRVMVMMVAPMRPIQLSVMEMAGAIVMAPLLEAYRRAKAMVGNKSK